jgi:hypothetical protein
VLQRFAYLAVTHAFAAVRLLRRGLRAHPPGSAVAAGPLLGL